jgi:small GTP-binding protein
MAGRRHSFKIVLLGDSAVGKTSIVKQYAGASFPDDHSPTIRLAYVTKHVILQGQTYVLHIWDTAGQEFYRSLVPRMLL